MKMRAPALLVLVVAALLLGPLQEARRARAEPGRLGAAETPLRLVPLSRDPIQVHGLHGFLGTVELDAAGDGLVVVDRLPLERYLLGLNEVPTDWPMEALRAQAVAARTYALWTLDHGPGGDAAVYGFDICASIECQVFSGADVLSTEDGDRWMEAVKSTSGKTILYEGRPILARYHSVSGGRTFANSDAFSGERDYPYLRPVVSPTEQASPLFRWRVTFEIDKLQAMLEQWGWWETRHGRLQDVRTVTSRSDSPYPDVVLSGKRARIVRPVDSLREVVRELGPSMFPETYPSLWPTSTGRLPETLPSERVSMRTRRKVVVVKGRGWGHGTGMSQWGAYGLARQGADHEAILQHYYSGVTLGDGRWPGPVEVGVDWSLPRTSATGSFRIEDAGGRVLVPRALGTWGFDWAGENVVAIDPPRGAFLPLEVGIVEAPERVRAGSRARLTIALSRPARIAALPGEGKTGAKLAAAGRRRLLWRAPSEPGAYSVRVRASTGGRARHSESVRIEVVGTASERRFEPPTAPSTPGYLGFMAVALVVLIAGGATIFVVTIRR
jgi:stage II sporulation protein D